jgi:general L-amino acid transport system permease protein
MPDQRMMPLATRKMSRAVFIERLPAYIGQAILLSVVAWLVWRGVSNFEANARALGLSAGYGFLYTQAGFQIAQTLMAFGPASSYLDAIIVAVLNTLLVVALASVFSTVIALCIAFGRLAPRGVVPAASAVYVEVFRNIPLLLQILFWYFSAIALLPGVGDSLQLGGVLLNNRGLFFPRLQMTAAGAWAVATALLTFVVSLAIAKRTRVADVIPRLGGWVLVAPALIALCVAPLALLDGQFALDRPRAEGFDVGGGFAILPELMALTLGLSIYNSTFLAEIFRAGVLSVPRGQIEAAATVGLSGIRAALLITLPQALRVALPAAGGQYQTLAKASSLAAAIGYPDIMQIVGGTVASQTSQALEAMTLVVLLYAAINLLIALLVGVANRRLLRREGR